MSLAAREGLGGGAATGKENDGVGAAGEDGVDEGEAHPWRRSPPAMAALTIFFFCLCRCLPLFSKSEWRADDSYFLFPISFFPFCRVTVTRENNDSSSSSSRSKNNTRSKTLTLKRAIGFLPPLKKGERV